MLALPPRAVRCPVVTSRRCSMADPPRLSRAPIRDGGSQSFSTARFQGNAMLTPAHPPESARLTCAAHGEIRNETAEAVGGIRCPGLGSRLPDASANPAAERTPSPRSSVNGGWWGIARQGPDAGAGVDPPTGSQKAGTRSPATPPGWSRGHTRQTPPASRRYGGPASAPRRRGKGRPGIPGPKAGLEPATGSMVAAGLEPATPTM